ncbi:MULTISPECIES: acylphosphatase [Legionella]|uniref:Acylphosphatase n=1 Tax=Legionella maceachernii TaxID=466 RepID=A0A0W0WG15_9GAMM|nr:acylphosphatase [Legionella maceachernii]KTD31279.1 acylphosphatase [Legionella maceachernii]SKA00663.1 acylphosphatase [Legionella maceachernii]SUP01357.1 Acylphosphatase [Legionella maceachernii]
MAQQLCMRCYLSGKVQGVWFRASAKEQAQHLGISGWARNLADGRVEVFACGEENQLQHFYDWLKQGPPHAQVTEYTREDLPWKDYQGFDTF